MRTRSQSREQRPPPPEGPPVVIAVVIEPLRIEYPFQEDPPVEPMADTRTMAQLLQAPTEGYEDAILIPEIMANNFELRHGLINLVQNKQFFGHDKEDPHAHIRYFNKITSTMRVPNVPIATIKLMLFPFSIEGAARIWLEKEPPRSIQTWDDLVSKFINQFFPPSKTTNLRNEITRFQQRFDESFYEAWDRFNDLLRACPHHGFSELHQLDTFYNALNSNDQDSLNSAAGGNFLDKMPRECLKIIERKSKVRNSRSKPVVAKVSTSTSTSGISPDVSELKDMVKALLLDKKNQSQAPAHQTSAPVKAVKESCVTCGGAHLYQNCPATDGNVYHDNIEAYVSQAAATNFNQGNTGINPRANDAVMRNVQNQGQILQAQLNNLATSNQRLESMLGNFIKMNTASTSGTGTLLSNTVTNPKEDLKGITTRSGVAYQGPTIPTSSSSTPKVVNRETEVTKDKGQGHSLVTQLLTLEKDLMGINTRSGVLDIRTSNSYVSVSEALPEVVTKAKVLPHPEQKHSAIRTHSALKVSLCKMDAKARLLRWVLLTPRDCPDCEDSQFCHSSRVSHPQLHFGKSNILILSTNEVDINKKTENQAKMTKLSMEWKRLCKIKAKVQKCQSQSQYRRISSQTGAGTEEYY
ncbi:reverse transcriptase domain-containing protein [Tanacetum coccineum]